MRCYFLPNVQNFILLVFFLFLVPLYFPHFFFLSSSSFSSSLSFQFLLMFLFPAPSRPSHPPRTSLLRPSTSCTSHSSFILSKLVTVSVHTPLLHIHLPHFSWSPLRHRGQKRLRRTRPHASSSFSPVPAPIKKTVTAAAY